MRRAAYFITAYLALSTVIVALWFIESLPDVPTLPETPREWGIAVGLFLLALPATVVLEAIGAWLHDNRITRAVEERTKGVRTSGVRIAYNLAYFCLVLAIVVGLTAAWRAVFPG